MLRNKTDSNSSDSDVRSLLLFQNKPLQIRSYTLTIDNQLWRSAYKMLWFSSSSTFSPCFSMKVKKHCMMYWEYLNNTCKGGFCALCCKRTIKINHKNYLDSKILWSLHISPGRKPEPSPYSQKNPNQPPGNKREALRSWKSKDTSDPFISTTNVLITYHADVKLYIHISNSEKGQHIIHE